MTDKSQPIQTAPGFFEGRYRNTEAACPQDFNHNAYEAVGNRVSLLCPSDLLSREYRFFIEFGRFWGQPIDADGNPCGNYCANVDDGNFQELSVRRFADGEDIKWSIQPIPNE